MTGTAAAGRSRIRLSHEDLVDRWSQLHSAVPFVINDDEAQCLRAIALNIDEDEIAHLLLRKVALARLLHPSRMPLDVVALGAVVEFSFAGRPLQRQRLTHPHGIRLSENVSVASLLGAGLIGLEAGQCILWPDENGKFHDLRVQSVTYGAANGKPLDKRAANRP